LAFVTYRLAHFIFEVSSEVALHAYSIRIFGAVKVDCVTGRDCCIQTAGHEPRGPLKVENAGGIS
jgi:hypothetical protein